MSRTASLERYNSGIKEWAVLSELSLINRVHQMDIMDTTEMLTTIQAKTDKWQGEVDRIYYPMKRYFIMTDKGAGSGYSAKGGQLRRITTMPSRTGKKRVARPWFSEYMANEGLRSLTQRVARLRADLEANNAITTIRTTLRVPGI
jgi:hypothetical protein